MSLNDQNKIYVGGLAYDVDEELLRKEFEYYGDIVSVKIVVDHEGQSCGYGFVTYSTLDAANAALDAMHGKCIGGRAIKVNGVRQRGAKSISRDSSYRDSDRDRRDKSGRDNKDRSKRDSPRRRKHSRGRCRSPDYRKKRSPRNDRSRSSRSRSNSAESYRTHDRTKLSKEAAVDNLRLKEDLAKAIESQKSRRDQLSTLEVELQRARATIEELKNKEKKLEISLSNASAALSESAEHFKKVQRAFLEVRDCKEKLKKAEAEFQELLVDVSLDVPDFTRPLANGDINTEESKKKLSDA